MLEKVSYQDSFSQVFNSMKSNCCLYMLEKAYRVQAAKLNSQKLQGFSGAFDALHNAYISLMDADLTGKSQDEVEGLLYVRMTSRNIDRIKKSIKQNEVALDWRENSQPQNCYEAFKKEADTILNDKQKNVLSYVLSGYKFKEIAEIFQTGTSAISRIIGRIIDKLGLYFTSFDVSIFDSGKSYFTEDDLIYMIDNRDCLLENL